jgi:hypothetical protein
MDSAVGLLGFGEASATALAKWAPEIIVTEMGLR